jgi:hypothetical protein
MNNVLKLVIQMYGLLLQLYPKAFRNEFKEEMFLDFFELLKDAEQKGISALVRFCMREAVDFPINLLHVYAQQGYAFQVLRARPVNFALRGALGYGIIFGLAILISEVISFTLYKDGNSIIGNIQVFFFDLFHTEYGLELIAWLPHAIASLLSGLGLGILLAILFGDRSKYSKYILAGMLGWFLHDAVTDILWSTTDLSFFLGTRHSIYLFRAESVLAGAFLAFTFIVANSEKRESMRWLVISSLTYPLIAYLYVRLLFELHIVETPWMFIALMGLMIIYIGSVFVVTLRSGVDRKTRWMMAAGAVGYPLIPYTAHSLLIWLGLLIPFPEFPAGGAPVGSALAWQFIFRLALDNAISGTIFGLIVGLIFGLLHEKRPQFSAA